jgi:hypothetical protein
MHAAIVVTLFFAAATAGLAAYDRLRKRHWPAAAIGAAMAARFAFAAVGISKTSRRARQ